MDFLIAVPLDRHQFPLKQPPFPLLRATVHTLIHSHFVIQRPLQNIRTSRNCDYYCLVLFDMGNNGLVYGCTGLLIGCVLSRCIRGSRSAEIIIVRNFPAAIRITNLHSSLKCPGEFMLPASRETFFSFARTFTTLEND